MDREAICFEIREIVRFMQRVSECLDKLETLVQQAEDFVAEPTEPDPPEQTGAFGPCPRCRKIDTAEIRAIGRAHVVQCVPSNGGCGHTTDGHRTAEDARKDWNRQTGFEG